MIRKQKDESGRSEYVIPEEAKNVSNFKRLYQIRSLNFFKTQNTT
jgi:hypothetical protein